MAYAIKRHPEKVPSVTEGSVAGRIRDARRLIELAGLLFQASGIEGDDIGSAPSAEWGEDVSDFSIYEEHYKKLGWNKGPFGAPEAKEAVRRFWMAKGVEGAAWLLERIRDEHAVDVLDAVAEIVGDAGRTEEDVIAACLDLLERHPTEEQENVALTALRWMAAPAEGPLRDRLCRSIERYMQQPDALLKEKAVLATRALPEASMEALFKNVYEDADDPTRELINEERARRVLRR